MAKLKVLRISKQWEVREVISAYTNIDLIRTALTKRYNILEGGLMLYLTLDSNEYQSFLLKFASNVVKKLPFFFRGRGSLSDRHRRKQTDTDIHR